MLTLLCDISATLQSVGNVLLALLILLFMITIHEFGHFVAGRLLKFQINEFAIGMGPKLISKKAKDGTVYSLRLLPLGGFCAFEGEGEDLENPKAFNNQKPWKRIIVLVSGALFNFISAVIICAIVFGCYGDTVVKVRDVYDYAPTINQQLEGKTIYKINGNKVYVLDGISRYMDKEMVIEVIDENGNFQTINGVTTGTYYNPVVKNVTVQLQNDQKRPIAIGDTFYSATIGGDTVYFGEKDALQNYVNQNSGVALFGVMDIYGDVHNYALDCADVAKLQIEQTSYSGVGMSIGYERYKFSFGESMSRVLPYCGETAMYVLRTLGDLITGVIGFDQVGGPISTIGMTSQVVSTGFSNVLFLIVLISVNLAVFNLLPVPALDGCQILFTVIEWIVGKPINRKVQGWINGVGLIVLLAFAVLVDLLKL